MILVAGFYAIQKIAQPKEAILFDPHSSQPIIFLLPHQDDEMFMLGAMQRALATGRPNYVVMVTDGGASVIRQELNGMDDNGMPVYAGFDHRIHHPDREGYAPLSRQQFAAARNREFFESMLKLGLAPDHILFANPGGIDSTTTLLYPDGKLTTELAAQVIQNCFKRFGNGTYSTVAGSLNSRILLTHGDHGALRNALRAFPGISQKYFFSEKPKSGRVLHLSTKEQKLKQMVLAEYSVWDPIRGRFAIAEHSVPALLKIWSASPVEYVLSPADFATSQPPTK